MADKPRRPTKRAQALRNGATDCERLLWLELRQRRLEGHKFSRQIPVGPFICDFVCRRLRLVVELDGGQHSAAAEADARRTAFLEAEGYRVIRFWNNDVIENLDGVLRAIDSALEACPPPNPLPVAEGEAASVSPPPAPPASGRGVGEPIPPIGARGAA
ncbi:MAG: endonuclease domain-containing protein [Alphaproteobacteria bacterium]|nr:endonuclease domain-containing protein [Alphaproteobacteria bacterium]MBV9371185.1 endonuclease domain-containing protein [Alphaproteobacteria bacterium]MBV9899915.1 endonuclease domain-containing protein [Alphaproteobacteria bacterium]